MRKSLSSPCESEESNSGGSQQMRRGSTTSVKAQQNGSHNDAGNDTFRIYDIMSDAAAIAASDGSSLPPLVHQSDSTHGKSHQPSCHSACLSCPCAKLTRSSAMSRRNKNRSALCSSTVCGLGRRGENFLWMRSIRSGSMAQRQRVNKTKTIMALSLC